MSSKLRNITAATWRGAKHPLAYLCAGIAWIFTTIATVCMFFSDLAKGGAARLRR